MCSVNMSSHPHTKLIHRKARHRPASTGHLTATDRRNTTIIHTHPNISLDTLTRISAITATLVILLKVDLTSLATKTSVWVATPTLKPSVDLTGSNRVPHHSNPKPAMDTLSKPLNSQRLPRRAQDTLSRLHLEDRLHRNQTMSFRSAHRVVAVFQVQRHQKTQTSTLLCDKALRVALAHSNRMLRRLTPLSSYRLST